MYCCKLNEAAFPSFRVARGELERRSLCEVKPKDRLAEKINNPCAIAGVNGMFHPCSDFGKASVQVQHLLYTGYMELPVCEFPTQGLPRISSS